VTNSLFQTEQNTYNSNLEKWIADGKMGQYVLIKGTEVVGIFKDSRDAFSTGLSRFGLNKFFMSSIMPTDTTNITFMGVAI